MFLPLSLRLSAVAAMAPAITEARQTQNFKLPPPAHVSPATSVGVGLNGLAGSSTLRGSAYVSLANGHLKSSSTPHRKLILQNAGKLHSGTHEIKTNIPKASDSCSGGTLKNSLLDASSSDLANLTTLAIASEFLKLTESQGSRELIRGDNNIHQTSNHTMSNSDPSLGNKDITMGLQRANTSIPLESGVMRDNRGMLSNDMDQLLKNLGVAMNSTDLGSTTDLSRNMEELLQVFESIGANPDPAVPLTGVTDGIDPTCSMPLSGMGQVGEGNETDNSLQMQMPISTSDIAQLSNIESQILSDVDMMTMCVDVNLSDNLVTVNRETFAKERIDDVSKKQKELGRRCDRIERRLRKLQARGMGRHISEEITNFVDFAQKTLNISSIKGSTKESQKSSASSSSVNDMKVEILQKENVKSMSTSALVNLVRRLEMTQGVAMKHSHKYLMSEDLNRSSSKVMVKFSQAVNQEIVKTVGQLNTNLKQVECAMDSDATESSSGGESCDEMDGYHDSSRTHHVPIYKRASWQWAKERAAVASRWTWLQAQVSDLEYRIRQQNEIYRQVRSAKGSVILGDMPILRPTNRRPTPMDIKIATLERQNEMAPNQLQAVLMGNEPMEINSNTSRECVKSHPSDWRTDILLIQEKVLGGNPLLYGSHPRSNCSGYQSGGHGRNNHVVNGYHSASSHKGGQGVLLSGSDISAGKSDVAGSGGGITITNGGIVLDNIKQNGQHIITSCNQQVHLSLPSPPNLDPTCVASRTRPLKSFRKRKLLRSAGLHVVSKKAAKLNSVRCGCVPPVTPCTMCCGRVNHVASMDSDLVPLAERIALIDSSFHPVLSFPQDVPLSVYFEAFLKTGGWQKSALFGKQPKTTPMKGERDRGTERRTDRKNKKQAEQTKRKYTSRLKKSATNTLTAKLRKKLNKDRKRGRDVSLCNPASRTSLERLRKKRQAARFAMGMRQDEQQPALQKVKLSDLEEELQIDTTYSSDSKLSSPAPSPAPSGTGSFVPLSDGSHLPGSQKKEKERGSMLQDLLRRKRENSYDIDNIVIPYSIASSTRVERLQYKEILTPKWRIIDDTSPKNLDPKNNGVVQRSSQEDEEEEEEEIEDLSEEAIGIRHDRSEAEEKKKFSSFVNTNHHPGRGRSRRTDSRAESSGANTPDPLSPSMLEVLNESSSPIASPPATPGPPSMLSLSADENSQTGILGFGIAGMTAVVRERRRTTSKSRGQDRTMEDSRSATPDFLEEEDVAVPYEPRTFPLPDQLYEEMMKEMPPDHPYPPTDPSRKELAQKNLPSDQMSSRSASRPGSPYSTTTESLPDDDPNDPEWTISDMKDEQGKQGIVLKLSKR